MKQAITIFWFRRDLRLFDNAGLYHALKSGNPVLPLFIFDSNILSKLPAQDARVAYIHQVLHSMQKQLRQMGSDLLVLHGKPQDVWTQLLNEWEVKEVYSNHDFEPYAIERDTAISKMVKQSGADFKHYKDHVVFEMNEVLKDDGKPYTVFTPYSRKWKQKLNAFYLKSYPTEAYHVHFAKVQLPDLPSLHQLGFEPTSTDFPTTEAKDTIVENYHKTRDFPARNGTTKMGLHLRFGTVSIRQLAQKAKSLNETYLNELIWRDFYAMILYHFPQVVHRAFKPAYDAIVWRNNEAEFEKWKRGETGYPIVDAGMRELNTTGYMHNRVRMIVASFLTKHLLIDWRWGEAYFAEKLLDFDLASNNGGWQWAAGCGCDAAPYFRVFNPELQTKKFDPELRYIRKWVPEFESFGYAKPIVEHKMARERVLKVYKEALN